MNNFGKQWEIVVTKYPLHSSHSYIIMNTNICVCVRLRSFIGALISRIYSMCIIHNLKRYIKICNSVCLFVVEKCSIMCAYFFFCHLFVLFFLFGFFSREFSMNARGSGGFLLSTRCGLGACWMSNEQWWNIKHAYKIPTNK